MKTTVAQLEFCLNWRMMKIQWLLAEIWLKEVCGTGNSHVWWCVWSKKSHTKLLMFKIIWDHKNRMRNRKNISLTHISRLHTWNPSQSRGERFKSLDHRRILVITRRMLEEAIKNENLSFRLQPCTLRRISRVSSGFVWFTIDATQSWLNSRVNKTVKLWRVKKILNW